MRASISIVKCFFFFLFTFVSVASIAQPGGGSFAIKGKLIDEKTNAPVEFATIAVKRLKDSTLVSGAISDPAGAFRIDGLGPGGYSVEIAFIGYEKHTQKVFLRPPNAPPVTDLGVIKLKVSAQMLESTEIVADKSFVMNQIDRKTYDTEQLSVATGGNVTDVLENIPSVAIDQDGNISLRGNDNVTILIDGRPSGLTGEGGKSLLESLPASVIEKVEVITNPSAKYDPDGISGIINIVTKKNKLSGLTGNVGGTTSFDKGYSGNGSLNYRQGKWNLFSNFGYNTNLRNSTSESLRITDYNDVQTTLDQNGKGTSENQSFSLKAGADFQATDKSTLSFSTLYTQGNGTNDEYVWYDTYSDQAADDSLYRRDTENEGDDNTLDLEGAWKQYFKQEGRLINVQANASFSNSDENDLYTQTGYLDYNTPDNTLSPELQKDLLNRENRTYSLSADYEHPLGKDKKIEAGYKSSLRDIDNDFASSYYNEATDEFVNDTSLTNRFIYNDGVHALYAQYRQSVGKFGFQAGLRGEYAVTESELVNTGETFDKDYFSIFPSAYLTWKPDQKMQLKASYSRRINRPRTNQLNPFASYEDPLNIRTGNPYLDPEYTDSYEMEGMYYFSKMTLTATVYYRYTHDYIQRYRRYDPETGIANVTFENANSSQNLGLEVILNASLYKWWTFTLSGNFYQNILDAANIEGDLGSSDISISGRLFTTFKLPYNSELQVSYSYRAPFEVPQGTMKDMQMLNFAASKKVLKDKGTITFRVSDPLNISRFGIVIEDPVYSQDIYRQRDNTTFTLGFNYRFGELKDRDSRQRDRMPKEEMPDMGF